MHHFDTPDQPDHPPGLLLHGNDDAPPVLQQLRHLYDARVIRAIDYQFACFVYRQEPCATATLMAALISHATGHGHTCISLNAYLTGQTQLFGQDQNTQDALIKSTGTTMQHWPAVLQQSTITGDDHATTPLVLAGTRLYLRRCRRQENLIADFLNRQKICLPDPRTVSDLLGQLFPDQSQSAQPDQQKLAAALACASGFTVICGGPGTGKTTTVVKILCQLTGLALAQGRQSPEIILAAPTGKAAARLGTSAAHALQLPAIPAHLRPLIPVQAVTLHHLLGSTQYGTSFRHDEHNPLSAGIVVVDETSMADPAVFAQLLRSLRQDTTLILLGDRDQLASVEAGGVLAGICAGSGKGYSKPVAGYLTAATAQNVICRPDNTHTSTINDHICLLTRSFRFDAQSGISRLAEAVKTGNAENAIAVLKNKKYDDANIYTAGDRVIQDIQSLIVSGYRPWLEAVAANKPVKEVHALFARFQILCALRGGERGVRSINALAAGALTRASLLPDTRALWYPGRPVMITVNDASAGLFNGDTGIALLYKDKIRVAFVMPDGSVQTFLPGALPAHETAFAMTVHKSQGSEFHHVVMICPDEFSPVITRELLYTGITRAREKLDIFADSTLIRRACITPTVRVSGLEERLRSHPAV